MAGGGGTPDPDDLPLFAVDIMFAGSLSLAGCSRPCWSPSPATAEITASACSGYGPFRDGDVVGLDRRSHCGRVLARLFPAAMLIPLLVLLLLLSAVKVWCHD